MNCLTLQVTFLLVVFGYAPVRIQAEPILCASYVSVNSSTAPATQGYARGKRNILHEAILWRINEHGNKIKAHKIFAQHKSDTVPLTHRYYHLERFVVLAFTFQDLMRLIQNHYTQVLQQDDLEHLNGYHRFGKEKMHRLVRTLLHHVETDIGHADFLIEDYKVRKQTGVIRLDDFGSLIYERTSLEIRHYMYKFVGLALARLDDPVELAYLLETGDKFAGHFFGVFADWVVKFGKLIGHEFSYFGHDHLEKEGSHEDMFDVLEHFELDAEQFGRVQDLVDQHATNFRLFLDAKFRGGKVYRDQVLKVVPHPLELFTDSVTRIF